MNINWIDWTVIIILFTALNLSGWVCNRYSKGVLDFLAAGRSVGRYLGVGSDAMSGLAAVTILAIWQMCYQAGIAGNWWYLMKFPLAIILALTGWGVYRFRQTRALTIPQYLEMRYSKKFRIFAGMLAYIAGILNMGIFPVIGAGFFVYFCGLPVTVHIPGTELNLPTVFVVMVVLQATAVLLCFMGGQVTLIVTDFLQGVFVSIMFIAVVFVISHMFSWKQLTDAYIGSPNGASLIHPFKNPEGTNFDIKFFLIDAFWLLYWVISWSPNTMQVGSAKDAHEAKMMKVMGIVRQMAVLGLGLYLLPYAAFVLMHHPDFSVTAAKVNNVLNSIDNPQIRSQMIVPAAVAHILPTGLIGAFTAVVMFAFIACHNTYLLAWGGILVQDIIIPLRGKPLEARTHIWLLRFAVLASAVFTVVWSMIFRQIDDIFMYFDITGSIYLSGAGVVILGGIYWKRGTTTAAWVSMITGAILAGGGFIYKSYLNPNFINGRMMSFIVACVAIVLYIVVSLLTKDPKFNLNSMLHRTDRNGQTDASRKWWRFSSEFSRGDKIIYGCIGVSVMLYLGIFTVVNIYNLRNEVSVLSWMSWWHIYFYSMFIGGSIFLIWITIGGVRDLIRMFRLLRKEKVDMGDDGRVVVHEFESVHQKPIKSVIHNAGATKAILFLITLSASLLMLSGCCLIKKAVYQVNRLNPENNVVIDANWDKSLWCDIPELELKNHMGAMPSFFPRTRAKLLYDEKNIYVIWRVDDRFVKSSAVGYKASVWEDSCVEFFFAPDANASTVYFNLETNCGGTVLIRHQHDKGLDVVFLTPEDTNAIEIASSLPKVVDPEIKQNLSWTIEYKIPLDILFKYGGITVPKASTIWRANFYKCAEKTSNPHWLTWAKVGYKEPIFHAPEYFGTLKFE